MASPKSSSRSSASKPSAPKAAPSKPAPAKKRKAPQKQTAATTTKKAAPKQTAPPTTGKKPTLRDAQRALTRERILDAAALRFADPGYATTTVDDIVEEADVGRATFYLHFGSRQEVMQALLQRVMPIVNGLYDDLLALPVIDHDALIGWVERFFGFYAANKGVLNASMQAETIDLGWSRQIETLSWQLVARFSPRATKREAQQTQALILLQELDRVAYLLAVRGWKLDSSTAASVLAEHWLEFFMAVAPPSKPRRR